MNSNESESSGAKASAALKDYGVGDTFTRSLGFCWVLVFFSGGGGVGGYEFLGWHYISC